MEEGEEPVFTHAEETMRQIRRENRRKRKEEEFEKAKETCMCFETMTLHAAILMSTLIDKPSEDAEAVGDPYRTLFIGRLVSCSYRKITYAGKLMPLSL